MPDRIGAAAPRDGARTTCPYCGVGCGVIASRAADCGWTVSGDPRHPANFGRLCSKGSALAETLSLDGRLLHPMIGDRRVSWNEALDVVAGGFRHVIERDGPDAVAFYVSGQLLTEDYYVANKLMKGFIGSANIDTNSRLCMASSVAGHKRAFGSDTVPGCYEDLDEADLIVLVGSNAAWCHPVLFQRMIANKERRGARLVVIDPRRTVTAEAADLHLPLLGGSDTVLFNGLLVELAGRRAIDRGYIETHTRGFADALAAARDVAPDIERTAALTGLATEDVARFFAWFAETRKVVTCYSQGVNQSVQGTDKVNAIINCHLATGRIGGPGAGPLSLTGQPNAMGGREVGGLANQLAAHMGFDEASIDRVGRFWKAPRTARREGLKAVDLFRAVEDGRIKALWIMATNPVVSLPRAEAVRRALCHLELLVVSDNVLAADTATLAKVRLPACAWGEKDGTVTNSERRISRQRAFLPPPGEAKPDWWIVTHVARRLGHADAFPYESPAQIFAEHAALSTFENDGARDFDLGGLATLTEDAYDRLEPAQWPWRQRGRAGDRRLFADGQFFADDRRGRFVPVGPPPGAADELFPLRLNTGRIRDQWHTMTRTGTTARLCRHIAEPFVEVHPDDARAGGLADRGWVQVITAHGRCVMRVRISEAQQRGTIFAPIHWSAENSSHGRIGALVHPLTDAISGQPDSKATPARVVPIAFRYQGFVLSRSALSLDCAYWVRVREDHGWLYLVAMNEMPAEWRDRLPKLADGATEGEVLELSDGLDGAYRAALLRGGRLAAAVVLSAGDGLPAWGWLARLLGESVIDTATRRALLAGRLPDGAADQGRIVCACFGVGRNRIVAAIAERRLSSTAAIGECLQAGTNCGSCVPELRRILADATMMPDEPPRASCPMPSVMVRPQ
jgi:assimilatory nitrate reductase catalytic subunit